MSLDFAIDHDRLVDLCRKYHVAKLELFGSRARGTARPDSDVDLRVTFAAGHTPGLEFFGLPEEFATIFGHRVDVLTRPSVEGDRNPYFRHSVLGSLELLYAA